MAVNVTKILCTTNYHICIWSLFKKHSFAAIQKYAIIQAAHITELYAV